MGHWNIAKPQDCGHCLNSSFYGEHIHRGEMVPGHSFVTGPDLQCISVYRDLVFLLSALFFLLSDE